MLVEKLCRRLSQVRDAACDRKQLIKSWVDDPLPLSPWEIWTLLCLVRHRSRQQFVADTMKFRLGCEPGDLATAMAMGHPDRPQKGVVPGLCDWEYYFHGRGCCLTHRVTGEQIDVDFFDSTADWFDDFFFVCYLESLSQSTFVEQRLISLHKSVDTVVLSLERLLQVKLLEQHPDDSKVVRLAFDHEELNARINDVESMWHEASTQTLIAFAFSDWLMLETMFDDKPIHDVITMRARTERERRTNWCKELFRSGEYQPEALQALDDLESPLRDAMIAEALSGTASGTTSAALEIVKKSDDDKWCDHVLALMNRTDPNSDLPAPYTWIKCAEFLLRRGLQTNIRSRLSNICSQCLGEAAILALEFLPDLAIDLFRKALRSEIPCNRITAAAALAIIDTPWSRAELAAVLAECDQQSMTAECRSALIETHSQQCHELVADWEMRNPHEPERGEWITMEEFSLCRSDETIRWEMQTLHDRVLPLKKQLP